MSPDYAHGQAALMLCESLLHLLVEEGVITKTKAIEAIDGVAELARESTKLDGRRAKLSHAMALVETIADSFAAKDEGQVAKAKSLQLNSN